VCERERMRKRIAKKREKNRKRKIEKEE